MTSAKDWVRESALALHRREDRVFPELPAGHPLSIRRREVQRFRTGADTHNRRVWNPSTKDELHPFPQPALRNTNTCYSGVDVVTTHFPETVKGSAFLKMQETVLPAVWTTNRDRARASTIRHTYRCEALEHQEGPLSYLAAVIRDDNNPEKRRRQERWCASTTLEGFRGNRFIAPAPEDSSNAEAHRERNRTLTESLRGGYVTPYQRVRQLNVSLQTQKKLQQKAAAESLVGFYASQPGPAAFKVSNAHEWWDLDPVAVTRDMTKRAEGMMANPYSTLFRRTVFTATPSESPDV
ncbi:hypothetical protein LSCM1_02319 [Leishmania martiniquensis]|uniref:Uncharacterized protein n=1 Tax=Leishmania martiniquensis TaxID=1580590 RepID=A0A836GA63_9TRYP|nr:hypothetical protein LSCM1_02319 [Leishmania martiniquensis]